MVPRKSIINLNNRGLGERGGRKKKKRQAQSSLFSSFRGVPLTGEGPSKQTGGVKGEKGVTENKKKSTELRGEGAGTRGSSGRI